MYYLNYFTSITEQSTLSTPSLALHILAGQISLKIEAMANYETYLEILRLYHNHTKDHGTSYLPLNNQAIMRRHIYRNIWMQISKTIAMLRDGRNMEQHYLQNKRQKCSKHSRDNSHR